MPGTKIDPIAARDGIYTLRVSEVVGSSFAYVGSDGQTHTGTVTAVELDPERHDGPIAVFSVGYSDDHWMPLERVARLLLARRIRNHYREAFKVPTRCLLHDRYDDCTV